MELRLIFAYESVLLGSISVGEKSSIMEEVRESSLRPIPTLITATLMRKRTRTSLPRYHLSDDQDSGQGI